MTARRDLKKRLLKLTIIIEFLIQNYAYITFWGIVMFAIGKFPSVNEVDVCFPSSVSSRRMYKPH